MSTLILTDIHGNLPALQAVLGTPEARRCDAIVSLGDHVNFGPQSRAVHERLSALGAIMLLGNHEERLLHPDDAGFEGYNWRLMRFTARQMEGIDLHLPTDLRTGSALMTHGTPGDPYHLIYPGDLPQVTSRLPEGVTLLLSGHNHLTWDECIGGVRAVNPGSLGMAEDGPGCTAPFAVLEDDGQVTLHRAQYDLREVLRAFIDTGASEIAPEMSRAVARTMQYGEHMGVTKLIRHAASLGDIADPDTWLRADQSYPWHEAVSSPQYWHDIRRNL